MPTPEILVYVDPSSRGEWALQAGALLVPALAGRVALLATEEDARADPQLLGRARAFFEGRAESVRAVSRRGPAERAVLEESLAARYLAIVVPPAGRRALARLLRGSRVATVVRQVRSTVLVARRPPERVRRVLLAVAGGPHSPLTARGAAEVARALGAELAAVHVQSGVELPAHLPLVGRRAPGEVEADPLAAVQSALAEAKVPVRIHVREGLVVDELLAEIEEKAHDLLVIGAHRAEGVDRFVLDDVTERILLQCPIPILVIRPPEPEPAGTRAAP